MPEAPCKLDQELYRYLLSVSLRESPLLQELRRETAGMTNSGMQLAPEQGQLLALLVSLIGARNALEVGVFTGYSSLSIAQALPDDGYLLACDVNDVWTQTARRYWEVAGVAEKIELRLAPATITLAQLVDEKRQDSFDFAFIDADKTNYGVYYEYCLQLVRPGGLIAIDNVLWSGRVVDAADQSADTKAIRELNQKLYRDERVDMSLVPIGDGLTLLRKK